MEAHVSSQKFVQTPSGRIAYVEQGEGDVAFFVHGVIVNSHLWRKQLEALSSQRRCIAIDLMAHGATQITPDQDVSFDAQARMITQVLDALRIEQIDLVANDSGTGIAQIFAVNNPTLLRTLTLTNGDVHDNWPPKDFAGFLDMVVAGGLANKLQEMSDNKDKFRAADGLGGAYETPEAVSDSTIDAYLVPFLSDPGRLRDLERFILAFDNKQTVRIEERLKRLNVPTLVAWGTGDVFFDARWGQWLERTIPAARRRVELAGAHLFLPEERADELNGAILDHWSTHGQWQRAN
jgi:pimeloyl-ACP methyl ester carboxylesterase